MKNESWNSRSIALSIWLACMTMFYAPGYCSTIFDDDWKPPQPRPTQAPSPTTKISSPDQSGSPPQSDPVAAPTVAVSRLPVPSKGDLAKSRKLFEEVFAKELADRTPAGRRALAERLLAEADKSRAVPSDQYLLLVGATEAAVEASDLGLSFKAAESLASAFTVDCLRIKGELVTKLPQRGVTSEVSRSNCQLGLDLIGELTAEEDYDLAARVVSALRNAAVDPALRTRFTEASREIDQDQTAAVGALRATERLKLNPDDASANLAVARYRTFYRGDWERGLQFLAKSGTTPLASAAATDLAGPKSWQKQSELGDQWWTLADAETGRAKLALKQRATYWYEQALKATELAGLARARLEQRVASETSHENSEPKPPPSVSAQAAPPSGDRKTLWFQGADTEAPPFEILAGQPLKKIPRSEQPAVFADPHAYDGYRVVVFGSNTWRSLPADAFTQRALQTLQRFVAQGGDLFIFEQFSAGNMKYFDATFGVKTAGTSGHVGKMASALQGKCQELNLTPAELDSFQFYICWPQMPKDATVLLEDTHIHNVIVVVPFQRGRLILLGNGSDFAAMAMVQGVVNLIYNRKPAPNPRP